MYDIRDSGRNAFIEIKMNVTTNEATVNTFPY